jgi:hypothetical protein
MTKLDLDEIHLGENPKAPQTLNATPYLANTSKFTYATATDLRASFTY